MADFETQVVVIAGGPAGLSAAVQAAEDGAEVILIEKNAAVGGAANMGMGPLAIGSKYQQRQMIDITVEKALKMFMEYTHYNVDGRLVKRYFDQSAETIEWLEDMGVEFEGAYKYFTKSEATWHIVKTDQGIGPRAASFMNKALYARAQELGVTFMLETAGKKILKDLSKSRPAIPSAWICSTLRSPATSATVSGWPGKQAETDCLSVSRLRPILKASMNFPRVYRTF